MKLFVVSICFLTLLGCSRGSFSAEGVVVNIENGKDGYNAVIKTKESKDIHFTASRVDMGAAYKKVEMGDKVRVYGDTLHFGEEVHIHAKKIDQ